MFSVQSERFSTPRRIKKDEIAVMHFLGYGWDGFEFLLSAEKWERNIILKFKISMWWKFFEI